MKESILAQSLVQEFVVRIPVPASSFSPELLAVAALEFLRLGPDNADRADALRLAIGKANRHSKIPAIIEDAQKILDWPPEKAPVVAIARKPRPRGRAFARKK